MNESNGLIKIGLMIDSYKIPLWANILVNEITKLDYVEITVLLINNKTSSNNKAKNKSNKFNEKNFLYDFYLSYEKKRYVQKNNLCQNIICKQFQDIKEIKISPILKNTFDVISEEDILKIKKFELDVIIRLGFNRLSGNILSVPKFGIWSFFIQNNHYKETKFNGFWEIFRDIPVSNVNLYLNNNEPHQDKIIAKSTTATDPLYITRNNINKYWKNIELILNKLLEIHQLGKMEILSSKKDKNYQNSNLKEEQFVPSTKEIIQFMIKHWMRYLRIKKKFSHKIEQWGILFDFNRDVFDSIEQCSKIYPPEDRYYADPFVLKKNKEYFVFIEEVIYQKRKGHISYFKMDENGNYNSPKKILENKYHMSYPFVFEFENNYYMIPETSENKSIDLYKCKKFPDQWEFEKNIMKNVNAVDSTLLRKDNKWWLFTSIPFMESSPNDTLSIFYSDDLYAEEWNPLPKNPVISDVRKSRSAGKIFQINGEHYRPAQDCSMGYGRGITFNKIVTLNESEYSEEKIESIYSKYNKNIEGIHTFAQCEKLRILDFKKLKRQ